MKKYYYAPKVTNKKIISSAFVNLENDTDVEIMYLCQIVALR